MPPKGKEIVKLPDCYEKRADGDVRCLACDGDWIKCRSVAKHQQSAAHIDSLGVYEAKKAKRAASNLRQHNTVNLSHTQPVNLDSAQPPDPWVSNDLRHLDVNGLDTSNWDE
ncbi:hypothetical protein FRC11_003761, partial [Ceratobasidium sp. 423]